MLKGQHHRPERSIQKEKQMKQPQQITTKGAKTTCVDVWKWGVLATQDICSQNWCLKGKAAALSDRLFLNGWPL
jgi:hypothetical protein